jgi:hypothetical protein
VSKVADERRIEAANEELRRALARGPLRRDELIARIGNEAFAAADLPLVRVPPSGTWERRRADGYGLAEEWVGPRAADADADAGRNLLLRRYLGAFGPARAIDAADWMAIPMRLLAPVVERAKLRRFTSDAGEELVDLPRAPLPPGDTTVPPRFIGTWDAALLVHARGTGFLPEEYRPLIFHTKAPQSFFTFTVDGAVAGTWQVERAKERATLALAPFAPLPRAARDELREEGDRLVRWFEGAATSYAVRFRTSVTPSRTLSRTHVTR